ncbi:aminoacyl-tRNA hydrolase [Kordiimonas marina]|uniref:aminoacyl-tRNA hydrolase n=1 Tax=Kordiimonas marina TaxID=2872312 RepID=UPI001FF6F622|nr:aminoacyl-tRNA hydrolase [Kordiimonas marina]MCJ9429708.1 aminoacyl-tRNA hydrolase [Kordiimonas marina]
MLLFVGLGNPGGSYEKNRHNVGFMAVDEIVRRHNFLPWRKRFQGLVSEGTLGGQKILLLKPQTFMNLSGQAVGEAMRFFKLNPSDVFVLYDELDLAFGKVKVKTGGGAAGHNGIRSITQHIGADFHRVRIGIDHPGDKARVHGHVLGDFAKAEQQLLETILDAVAQEAGYLAAGDTPRFMSEVARTINPPRENGGGKKQKADTAAPAEAGTKPAAKPVEKKNSEGPMAAMLRAFKSGDK